MYKFIWFESTLLLVFIILIASGICKLESSVDAFVLLNDNWGQGKAFLQRSFFKDNDCKLKNKNGALLGSSSMSEETEMIEGGEEDDEPWVLRAMTLKGLDRSTEPQLLTEFLMELGACSTSITDHDRDTEFERPIFNEPDDQDINDAAWICGDQAVGMNVWKRCDVTAHFPTSIDLNQVADAVRYTLEMPTMPRYTVDDIPDRDWVSHVQSAWKPFVCRGNSPDSKATTFVLTFPWHESQDIEEALDLYNQNQEEKDCAQDSCVQIRLEGGIAFGTGEHPTTQLCLGWVADLYDDNEIENDQMFLDYGAGSGVLGIAACLCSPKVHAVGVEIDADAIRIADANAKTNKVKMNSYLPSDDLDNSKDHESASVSMKAKARTNLSTLPDKLNGPIYDACAANILARPLITLAGTIASMLKSNAKLGLSGVLKYQANDVVKAYSEYFHDVKIQKQIGEWVLITGTKM